MSTRTVLRSLLTNTVDSPGIRAGRLSSPSLPSRRVPSRRSASHRPRVAPLLLAVACLGCGGKSDRPFVDPAGPETPAVAPVGGPARLTPDETFGRLSTGLAEHRLETFYDLLPPRYREDLDATLTTIAEDADEELWNRGLASLRKALRVLREKPDLVLSHPTIEEGSFLRREHLETNWDAFVGLFSAALDGDSLELKRLRAGSARDLLSGPAASFLRSFADISKTVDGDPYGAFLKSLRGQRVEVVRQDGDEARLRIVSVTEPKSTREETWRRIDGHWLPEPLVLSWTQRLGTLRKTFGAGVFRKGASPEWRTAALARFDAIDERLDELLATDDPGEFHALFAETVLGPLIAMLASARGADDPREPGRLNVPGTEPAEGPNVRPADVAPEANAAKRPAVTTSVLVLVKGNLDAEAREVWQSRLGNVSDAPDFAICVPSIQPEGTLFEVNPVDDVEAYAKRLKFTTVESVDAKSRRVTVRAELRPR